MLALLLACSAALAGSLTRPDFYVSPKGSDQDPGTAKAPFATIQRAQEAARGKIAAGLTDDLTVVIREGRYEITEPLVFRPEDGGTEDHKVTYAADSVKWVSGGRVMLGGASAKAVVSGGRGVTGWRRAEGDLWTAYVPGVREGQWHFRQLFVYDRRAVRARMPNADAAPPGLRLAGAELSEDSKAYRLTFEPGVVTSWRNLADVEVICFGEWETMRKRLESVDEAAGVVTLQGPHVPLANHPWNRPGPGKACYLENAREFLDQPGEWCLDRTTGLLTYWPRPGEDMRKAVVIAPVATRLLEVTGTAEKPVRNLHFQGLRFEHAEWPLPPGGYQGVQACHYGEAYETGYEWKIQPAALHFEFAEDCSLTDGALAHLGGGGLFFSTGCSRNLFEGNLVRDIGGNGIMLTGPSTGAPVTQGNRLLNNYLHHCGADYQGGVGIWNGITDGSVISHNLVHDMPYTGISVGWQWNPEPTNCKANLIEYNRIHDCMTVLSDGGGIYTLGFQPGTVLRGNVIHDIRRSPLSAVGAPNNGMFIDEGSKGFLIEGNVIYATTGEPVRHNQNQPDWHTWKDNHFGIAPIAKDQPGADDPEQKALKAAMPRSGPDFEYLLRWNLFGSGINPPDAPLDF